MAKSGTVPDAYDGREQAFIKHELLKGYMEKLFFIVGGAARKGGRIELRYVDCFAGPWGDDSGDLKGTSIAISLQTLDVVRQRLSRNGVTATVRALYIEKEPGPFERLQAYLADNAPDGIVAEAWKGDFVAKRSEVLHWAGNAAFTFLPLWNFEWVARGGLRRLGGVKGGRAGRMRSAGRVGERQRVSAPEHRTGEHPAKRTLDADQMPIRCSQVECGMLTHSTWLP